MHMRLFLAVAFAAILSASPVLAQPGRYLYVVGCDAVLNKVDTLSGTKSERIDLATRTQGKRIIPAVAGALDGCLAYQAVYDPAASRFYTIVPAEAEPKVDGTKDYRLLGFSVPGAKLETDTDAGAALADPPHIALDREGHVQVQRAQDWSPRTDLDLAGYGQEGPPLRNQILESSGPKILLRLFAASETILTLGVADQESRRLTRLPALPETTARNVHLAPGGGAVLVEETTLAGGRVKKTGHADLVEVASGSVTAVPAEPAIASMAFLAIASDGKAIYHRNDSYGLISLGRKFDGTPVSRPFADGYPGYFFADR